MTENALHHGDLVDRRVAKLQLEHLMVGAQICRAHLQMTHVD